MITVFTPTYNRRYTLHKLYDSLCNQTSHNFEWLIVDDGSTDDTDNLIKSLINEKKITIRYIKQLNGGKHIAINRGIKEAKGNLFFIIDSDDSLTSDAIEWIEKNSTKIIDNQHYAGLSGIRIKKDGSKIGGGVNFGKIDADAISIRYCYHITGDLAEVYKTEILKNYPFPEFENEKFCPEALVWNRIAQEYKLVYHYKGIYICEYLPDGLTAKITKLRHNSPIASMTYYSELFHYKIPFKYKIKAAINFWRFTPRKHLRKVSKMRMLNIISLICIIPGCIMKLNDFRK